MPLKIQDTDKLKSSPAAPGKTPRNIRVKYGMGQKAELNTAADETDRQEYDADGLPRMSKYTVDKR